VTRAHDQLVKDVVVTVVVAIVLAIVFMALLLSCAFSGWGDRSARGVDTGIQRRALVGDLPDS